MDPRLQNLASFAVQPGFRGRSGLWVQIWWVAQAILIRPSPQPLHGWRVFWLRAFGARIGRGVKFRPSARVTYPWKLSIGDNAWIGDRAELYSLDRIEIGSDVCISQDAYICTGSHDMNSADFAYDCRPVTIEPEAWIAAGAFVGPGVTVGHGAVLAARSVTMKSLDALGVYVGQPARRIGERGAR